jgi:hypothetical protein
VNTVINLRIPKKWGISWLPEWLLAFQEGLCLLVLYVILPCILVNIWCSWRTCIECSESSRLRSNMDAQSVVTSSIIGRRNDFMANICDVSSYNRIPD